VQLKEIKSWRTKLNFDQIPKLKPKQRCFEDKKKDRLDNSSSGYYSSPLPYVSLKAFNASSPY
jgi:hypothetical protein